MFYHGGGVSAVAIVRVGTMTCQGLLLLVMVANQSINIPAISLSECCCCFCVYSVLSAVQTEPIVEIFYYFAAK